MKNRVTVFSIDVWRYTPLAAVTIALLVNVVNLLHVIDGQLAVVQGLERFALAYVLALFCVMGLSRLLTSYAHQLAGSARQQEEPSPRDAKR